MNIQALELYTETSEPLLTQTEIRFFFKYTNRGTEAIESIPAEIGMGDVFRQVTLPGLKAMETRTVEMVLTNNISDELQSVGVYFGDDRKNGISQKFTWMGAVDVRIGEMERFESMDNDKEVYYKIFIHNHGTRRAKNMGIRIEKDNDFYGSLDLGDLAPKTSKNINLGLSKKLKGLFKINIEAQFKGGSAMGVSRSFHVNLDA